MVEANPVRAPKATTTDNKDTLKPKPPKIDKKTNVNVHHPNTYFFKKYAKTLIPVSRVYLMRNADEAEDASLTSAGAEEAVN